MNEFLISVERFREQCVNGVKSLNEALYHREHVLSNALLLLILTAFFIALMSMPIRFTDTDLWYHLAGGQYTWQNWEINDKPFFSFLAPDREWVNYFWGFQVVVFKLHSALGYGGLVAFKAIIYLLIVSLFVKMMFHQNDKPYLSLLQLSIVSLIIIALLSRGELVRPQLISYLFIIVFIYVLFFSRKRYWLLPVLTVIWSNMHGIEWVVGALICGAYVLQQLLEFQKTRNKESLLSIPWVILCLPAVLINPFGIDLLTAPFNVSSDAYLFILELLPMAFNLRAIFGGDNTLSVYGAQLLLILFTAASMLILWFSGAMRVAPFVIGVGAFVLLFRGQRFFSEWLLLSSIVIVLGSQYLKPGQQMKLNYLARAIPLGFIIVSMGLLFEKYSSFETYPLKDHELPVATSNFIKKNNIKGNYFVHFNYAGYIEWELYPDVKVYMDMEFPPFNETDFMNAVAGMSTYKGANRIIKEYQPAIIGVSRGAKAFQTFSDKLVDYVPVSVDQALVLYLNRSAYPDLAEKYQIKYLDLSDDVLGYSGGDFEKKLEELETILSHEPNNPYVISVLVMALVDGLMLDRAAPWLDRLIDHYPELPLSYFINGVASYYGKENMKALAFFEEALKSEQLNPLQEQNILKHMAQVYFQQQDFENAYDFFEKGVNMYKFSEHNKTYYQYAYSAFIMDDIERSKRLCSLILLTADKKDEVYKNTHDLLNVIEQGDYSRGIRWF